MATAGTPALRRAHDQHRNLRLAAVEIADRLEELSTAVAVAAEEPDILGRIMRLEVDLDAHFRLEEEIGFVAAAVEEAPRLSRQAASLVGEHDRLRTQIAAIRSRADGSDWSAGDVRDAFRCFLLEIGRHEERENRLISEALLDDIGGRG